MILYELKCSKNHTFEAWFKDSSSYEEQIKCGNVSCPICSDTSIQKAIMSPSISSATRKKGIEYEQSENKTNMLFNKDSNKKIAGRIRKSNEKIQKYIEENCENVGQNFAEEARAIHYGESEKRSIYGEATQSEVSDLIEEDIPISSIPWKKNKLS
ncbi:MAG: DUF1178 family protein [Rhodospirillales bacterium]